MATDPNVAKLRWLLTVSAKAAGLDLTTAKINQVCAEEDNLMRNNGMVLMWQTAINEEAAKLAAHMTEA